MDLIRIINKKTISTKGKRRGFNHTRIMDRPSRIVTSSIELKYNRYQALCAYAAIGSCICRGFTNVVPGSLLELFLIGVDMAFRVQVCDTSNNDSIPASKLEFYDQSSQKLTVPPCETSTHSIGNEETLSPERYYALLLRRLLVNGVKYNPKIHVDRTFDRIVKSQGFLYDPLSVCDIVRRDKNNDYRDKDNKDNTCSLAYVLTIAGYSINSRETIDQILSGAEYLTRVTNNDPYDISLAVALAKLINGIVNIGNLNQMEKIFIQAVDAGSNIFAEDTAKTIKEQYLSYCSIEPPRIFDQQHLQFKCFGICYWGIRETINYMISCGKDLIISNHYIKFKDIIFRVLFICDNEYIREILCILMGIIFGAVTGHIPQDITVNHYRVVKAKIVNYLNNSEI